METMSGEVRVDSEGKWVTLDGPLTQAIRAAASGQRVLFAFDEVFRLSDKAEQGLMGILQPHDGVYEWRTCHGKDGAFEVLRASAENLHFISAGNLNGKTPSEAFWTRWEPVRIEFSEKLAVSTAESVLAKHGIDDARLAKMFASAMSTSRSLAKSGATNYALSFRTLERAAKFSGGSAKVTAAALAERISDTVAAWCPDSGDVVDASAKTAAALAAMFGEFSAE
jgi:MoxR-like ATPase